MMFSRRAKAVTIFVTLVLGAYLTGRLSRKTEAIPPDFKEARAQGAIISEQIVGTSNGLVADLARLSDLERARNASDTLSLADDLLKRSEEMKIQAQNLSEQLERMTAAIPEVRDAEARRLALEAITDRLALISRLISYSEYLTELLTSVRNRLAGLPYTDNAGLLTSQINAEVTAINNFNRQAAQAMEGFDKIVQ